jgi:type II secretory pathway pseudopilin PulG
MRAVDGSRVRRGAALIETLLALVVLALAGAGMISLLSQTIARTHDLHDRERDTAVGERLMETVASWSKDDLTNNLGVLREPTLWLEIDRPSPVLFDVVLRDTLYHAELLRTTLYRPDSA